MASAYGGAARLPGAGRVPVPGFSDSEKRGMPPVGPGAGGGPTGGIFTTCKMPDEQLVYSNRLAFHRNDFPDGAYVSIQNRRRDERYPARVCTVINDPAGRIPRGQVAMGSSMRAWLGSAENDQHDVEIYDPRRLGSYLADTVSMTLRARSSTGTDIIIERGELENFFRRQLNGLMLTATPESEAQRGAAAGTGKNMTLTVSYPLPGPRRDPITLLVMVGPIYVLDFDTTSVREAPMAVLNPETKCNFDVERGTLMQLRGQQRRNRQDALIKPDFKFGDLGIGGLDTEFANIFRRAFASRIFDTDVVEKLGIQHVKGILLYGPPGTGKTLMARQIGRMLRAHEPKIVNGPEILNKFVGQSEENIRKLFADAEKEYKEAGDKSKLHIIIFDELDAICKQRGSTGGGTGVGDSVVNQLLSKMDGVEQLNNILIIGMTNRLDMIDEALLRPGRLEVHIEISLPDRDGRLQILNIHTKKMRDNHLMASDVQLDSLADRTKNFSGAEIGGLIKSATSFAFQRHVKVDTHAKGDAIDQMQIGAADFDNALEEVKPAFGVAEEELEAVVENGIIDYDETSQALLRTGALYVEQVRQSERTPLVTVLVRGQAGSGKTALAARIAQRSEFPYIKLIAPESMVGFGEAQKIAHIGRVFADSYKSMLSIVVVDNIERLIDWVPIGPRFSNPVLQALLVCLTKRPPKGHRLLVLATTSNPQMLADMNVLETVSAELKVPSIDRLAALLRVAYHVRLFRPGDACAQRFEQRMQEAGLAGDHAFVIGVKKWLTLLESAAQAGPAGDLQRAETLFSRLYDHLQ